MSVPGVMVHLRRVLLVGAVVGVLVVPASAAARPRLKLVAPSAAVQPVKVLRVAGQLMNVRKRTVFKVRVQSARVKGTRLKTHLPLRFKRIKHREVAVVHLRFRGKQALPLKRYRVVMRGTYRLRHSPRLRHFVVRRALVLPPKAPGESAVEVKTVTPLSVKGAPFKPRRPRFEEDETNGSRWTVPTGPIRIGKPTPSTTGLRSAPGRGARASQGGTVIFRA